MLIRAAREIMRVSGIVQFSPGQVLRKNLLCSLVGADNALFVPAAAVRIECNLYISLPLGLESNVFCESDHADPVAAKDLPSFELVAFAHRLFPLNEVLALGNHERYGLF